MASCVATELVKRKDFCASVEAWCSSHGLHVFMLLSFTLKPSPRRQILLYRVPGSEAAYHRTVNIVEAAVDRLGADAVAVEAPETMSLLEQSVVSASRKQVLPVVFDGFAMPTASPVAAGL